MIAKYVFVRIYIYGTQFFRLSLICQYQKSITFARFTYVSSLSYITQDKFVQSSLYSIASQRLVGDTASPDCAFSSLVDVETGCLYATPALRPENSFARPEGPYRVRSSPIRRTHREPMNNPDDISPILNRHTSARIVVVTHHLPASVLSLLCNYFLSETTAGIWPSVREHVNTNLGTWGFFHVAIALIIRKFLNQRVNTYIRMIM